IGGQWRFLKQALNDWLRYGPRFHRDLKMMPPPWLIDHPLTDELLMLLERRVLDRLAAAVPPRAKPGSKEAGLKHFGVFKGDQDLDERLAQLAASRKAKAGEGRE